MEVYSLRKGLVYYRENLEDINPKELTWIRLKDPDKEKISLVADKAEIDKEDVLDFLDDEERSRIEFDKQGVQIIYMSPIHREEDVDSVSLFVKKNFIVSIERKEIFVINKLAKGLQNNRKKFFLKKNTSYFLYNFLDEINERFVWQLDKITRKTDLIKPEKEVTEKQLADLYENSTQLAAYNQAILANLEVISPLRKTTHKLINKDDKENFDDLYHDTLQVLDRERIQREVITNLFNFQTALSTLKTNESMKKLSFLAIIVIIPTIISSLYGMNVSLPLAKNPYAFWYISIISIAISVITYLYFTRKE